MCDSLQDAPPASDSLSVDLLAWYDSHAREMPWRVGPAARAQGVLPDPYRVWLSEVMLQQTTVAAVRAYFLAFTTRWPTVHALAAARDEDVMAAWAGLGYYARARNLLKCARTVSAELGGQFPDTMEGLLKLPGIGPYTAAAIAAIAFDRAEAVVDGNVDRVMVRLFDLRQPVRDIKPAIRAHAAALTPALRPGDYAQAVMDLGATICTPRTPACGSCPIRARCAARIAGVAKDLPVKPPRAAKPVRHGVIYLARRTDGAWLVERRPDRGLLGGMLGWPGSEWTVPVVDTADTGQTDAPPVAATWTPHPGEVRHTFTHFHLVLNVRTAELPADATPERGFFLARDQFDPDALPTVMRKAWALVVAA